jgi:thiosulfate dehydrogenase
MVKRGRDIFRDTRTAARAFVGNDLRCSNCHLDAGRLADASPLWAAWVAFPEYRAKNHKVNTFQARLQDCFRFSMDGAAPPLGDDVLIALETYSACSRVARRSAPTCRAATIRASARRPPHPTTRAAR